MKRTTARGSTTATPSARKFPLLGPRAIPVALASSTAVTLPSALVLLHGHSLPLTLAVGLLPSLIVLLVAVPFVTMYTAASIFAILMTAVRVARGRDSPADCLDDLFRWITNIPIAFLTLTLLKERSARAAGRANAVAPLPPATPGAARKQDTPVYWEAFQEMSSRPGGASDSVDPDEPITQPIHAFRGKHARLDSCSEQHDQPKLVTVPTPS